jgi:cytochrome c5
MRLSATVLILASALPAMAEPVATRKGMDGFITVDRLPVPDHPALAQGRILWGDTCQNCHGGDKLTGAPKITSTKAWDKRIAKGMDVLTGHAITGFIGPRFTEMPARGGNSDLSDAEVSLATAFMVWASGGAALAEEYANSMEMKDE